MFPAHVINVFEGVLWDAFVQELLAIDIPDRVHVLDNCVHQGLGEAGLIKLVMSHLSVADEIDDDIFTEFLTILSCNTESIGDIVH